MTNFISLDEKLKKQSNILLTLLDCLYNNSDNNNNDIFPASANLIY